jgi:hypothetical protein
MVEILDLTVEYHGFDEENIKNHNSAEISAGVGCLNLIYIEKFIAKSNGAYKTKHHKIIQK